MPHLSLLLKPLTLTLTSHLLQVLIYILAIYSALGYNSLKKPLGTNWTN